MTVKYLPFLLALFLFACSGEKSSSANEPPNLVEDPKTIALNTEDGYETNQHNGEKIKPIKNSLGKEVESGKTIPFLAEVIQGKSFKDPERYKVGEFKKIKAHPNVTYLDSFPAKDITRGDLFQNRSKRTPYKLVTTIGDTLKTLKAQRIQSNPIKGRKPKNVKAKAPRFKDSYVFNFQYLDVEQGLNSSYVFGVDEDKYGNIWLATWGGGLSVYDGSNFKHYTKNEGLTNNYVRKIFIDSKGNVWAGMEEGGLNMLEFQGEDGNTVHQFTEAEGLSGMVVYEIFEDFDGNIWIGHEEKGLSRLKRIGDNEWEIRRFTTNEGLSDNNISSIIEDDSHNLIIGTSEGGLNILKYEEFSEGKFNFYWIQEKDGLPSNYVSGLAKGKGTDIWVASEDYGVVKLKVDYGIAYGTKQIEYTHYTTDNGLSSDMILSIYADVMGRIWIGTDGAGLNLIEEDVAYATVSRFSTKHGLPHDAVFGIFEDDEYNIWFGTDGGGVVKHAPGSFSHFTENESLPYPVVLSMIEDQEMNIWFGTDGGGIAIYDDYDIIHLTEDNGLVSNVVWTMTTTKDSSIWIGTNGGGLSKLEKTEKGNWYDKMSTAQFTNFTAEQGFPSVHIVKVIEDYKGDIWMATWGEGLIKLVENEDGTYDYHHFTEASGLTKSVVFTIFEDSEKNIWIGSENGGLSKITNDKSDNHTITHFTTKEGLGSNDILTIHEDEKQNLWIGTEGAGLVYFNREKETFTTYSEENGLIDDLVWSINEDRQGNIWCSSEKGISMLKPTDDGYKISVYRKQDGLKAVDFYNNSSLLSTGQILWWGSGKSLTRLNLKKFDFPINKPSIHLNKIEINEFAIRFPDIDEESGIEYEGIESFFDYPNKLNLPHDQNHVTFHFTGIDWNAQHKLKYSYMVEGLNSNWSIPRSENKAEYRNLPYGTYVFKVRAIGASGEWSEVFSYEFTIRKPWWHTWWARFLYVLLIVTGFVVYVRWRTKKLKHKQKELEVEVANATAEISQQHQMLEESYKEITDSIAYAKRIQKAILPPEEVINEYLDESFVLYKPKDVVAGDFYWLEHTKDTTLIAVADCTGHGVPGAMVSVVCNNALNRSVRESGITDPGRILDESRDIVLDEFGKSDEEVNDGMDIALIAIEWPRKEFRDKAPIHLSFAGAHNPVWIIRQGKSNEFEATLERKISNYESDGISMIEIKGNKQPVGRFDYPQHFKTHQLELMKGDMIYMFTDGILDQFGGKRGKKFKAKALRNLLLEIYSLPLDQQKAKIDSVFEEWKGGLEQIDDVCIMGIKI